MADRRIQRGATDQSVEIRIVDNATGEPISAAAALAGRLWYYKNDRIITEASAGFVSITAAHADNTISHIKDGYHRANFPDEAWSAGAETHVLCGYSAVSAVSIAVHVDLVDYDPHTFVADLSAGVSARIQAGSATMDDHITALSAGVADLIHAASAAQSTQFANLSAVAQNAVDATEALSASMDDEFRALSAIAQDAVDNIATLSASLNDELATLSGNIATNITAAKDSLSATIDDEARNVSAGVSDLIHAYSATHNARIATLSAGVADNILALSATMSDEFDTLSAAVSTHGGGSDDAESAIHVLSANFQARFDTLSAVAQDAVDDIATMSASTDDRIATLSANIATNITALSAGVSTRIQTLSASFDDRIQSLSASLEASIIANGAGAGGAESSVHVLSAAMQARFDTLSAVAQDTQDNLATLSANFQSRFDTLSASVAAIAGGGGSAGFIGYYRTTPADVPFVMKDFSGSLLGGLTITGTRSIDKSSASAVDGSITEIGGHRGQYVLSATSADLGGVVVTFGFSAPSAETVYYTIPTTPLDG